VTVGSLLGRQRECAELDRLVADTATRSRVLVLRGEAGSGKTALLDYLIGLIGDRLLVSAVGVESEMELAYSGLHQLCAPVLHLLDRLPAPQRRALEAAFGLSDSPVPDRFMVGLAILTLLAEATESQPLVCVVDDGQWLDHASAQLLAFATRRLQAEPIAVVCAARTGIGDEVFAGLPELRVSGLADADARELLLSSVHGPLDVAICDRIVAESRGNPLALFELPRTWSAELAGGFGLPDLRPIADKIEQSYIRRLLELPADTRLLLLVAAAEPLGDAGLLDRAVKSLGIDPLAANAAADAELLQVRGRVEFAHPLVRSAAYRAAVASDRQRAHRALAEATRPEMDPDRRAWHLARAAAGPDEDVAAELELSAGRARTRGGVAAAAAFLTRATELTPSPAGRGGRAIEAGFAQLEAGAFEIAGTLADLASNGPLDDLQRARVDLLRAQLAFGSSWGNEALPLLLAAARRLESVDVRLARETYSDAFSAALFGGRLNDRVGVPEVAAAIRAAPRPQDSETSVGDQLLDALVSLTDDYATAAPLCRALVTTIAADSFLPVDRLRWLWLGSIVAWEVWDEESAFLFAQRHVQAARETGALGELEIALSTLSHLFARCGELSSAAPLVAESQSVREATGISATPYGALMLTAWRGSAHDARAQIETASHEAYARGEGIGGAICDLARAVLGNSLGDYADAQAAAASAAEYHEIHVENNGLPELVEAATRNGRIDLATEALDRLAPKARASGTRWALGIEARSRALVSEGDNAENLFQEAVDHLSRTRARSELARAHLLYGEWLRREARRVDARRELSTAHDMFTAMGLHAFAERTRRELLATGATVRKRSPQTRTELTAQETQIALLARDGSSNAEIAAMLFVSPRTVEWHLRKVFTKLGISRRSQLGAALPDQHHPVASAG
jgi:DNA-binding CsgD family transcriptional regulator